MASTDLDMNKKLSSLHHANNWRVSPMVYIPFKNSRYTPIISMISRKLLINLQKCNFARFIVENDWENR